MWLWVAGLAVVAIAIGTVWLLASKWAGTAAKGGGDREARKRLEEMAKREKEATNIESGPTPLSLNEQLARLRERLHRGRS